MATVGSFRNSLNGFNKQDVANYLESAASRYNVLKIERDALLKERDELKAAQQTLKDDAAKAQKKAAEVQKTASETQSALDVLQEELIAGKEREDSLQLELDELKEELSRCRAQLDSAENALRDKTNAAAQLEQQLRAMKQHTETRQAAQQDAAAQELAKLRARYDADTAELADARVQLAANAERLAEYDAVSSRVARLELDSTRRAYEIEKEAQQKAQDIVNAARLEQNAMQVRQGEMADSFRSAVGKVSDEAAAGARLVEAELNRLRARLLELSETLTGSAGTLCDFIPETDAENTEAEQADA